MAVKKYYSKSSRPVDGWHWDARRKRAWSWSFKIRLSNGTRKFESGFCSESDAQQAVARIRRTEKEAKYELPSSIRLRDRQRPLLSEAIEKYLATLVNRNTRAVSRTTLRRFHELLADKLNKLAPLVEDATTALMWDYIHDRLNFGRVQPETVNREMNPIAACLHKATEFFPELARWNCPRIARPKLDRKKRRGQLWTAEQSNKLFNWLSAPEKRSPETNGYFRSRQLIAQMFLFASLSSARVGELFKMRARDVALDSNSVTVIDWKTGGYRVISPMPDTMRRILAERLAAAETEMSEFVFTRSGSIPKYFYQILKDGCRECQIPYGKNNPAGLRFHDLRHTATTNMLRGGADLATVQSVTGHSDKTMVLFYSHPSTDSRRQAAEILEKSVGWHEKDKRDSGENDK